MKIGITADVHMKAEHECPERYNAFTNILDQCCDLDIKHLIIAGDLFDQTMQNYGEFEALCKKSNFSDIKYHIIPGNHDPNIQKKHFATRDIHVYSEPTWVDFDAGWSFLFIPYIKDKSMGEVIQDNISLKTSDKWCLVGHGDWSAGLTSPNPYEPGVFMPITNKDITIYKPDYVFLGHIHIPIDSEDLYYPGSPCGLNITETGYRRFLVFNLETNSLEFPRIQTDVIYFIDELIILPTEDESQFIKDTIQNSIKSWGLDETDHEKVRIRVRCRGYSSNKAQLLETIKDSYKSYQFESEPDISEVFIANDLERDYLMDKVRERVKFLDWEGNENDPSTDDILLEAMHLIYGEK